MRRLIPFGTVFSFSNRLQVLAQGSRAEEVFLLETGIVKLVHTLPDGSTELFSLRYPGQFIEGSSHLLRIPHSFSAFTVTPCEIYRIEARRLLEAIRQIPELAQFILQVQGIELFNTAIALIEMKTLRPHERLVRCFWELASVIGKRRPDRSTHVILPLSDKEIAQLLGISLVHLKRSRKHLENLGRLRREGSRGVVLLES